MKQRFENYFFGTYETAQGFYTCPHCNTETNCVEWLVRIIPKSKSTTMTCPKCYGDTIIEHNTEEGEKL